VRAIFDREGYLRRGLLGFSLMSFIIGGLVLPPLPHLPIKISKRKLAKYGRARGNYPQIFLVAT